MFGPSGLEEDLALVQVNEVKLSDKIKPAFIRDPNFQTYQKKYEEKSLTVWKLIRGLCGPEDKEGESMSGQLYKSRDLSCSIIMGNIFYP